jgi:hypothetical protein
VRATLNVFAGRKDNGRDTFGSGRLFGRDTTIDPSGSGSRMTDYEATPTNPAKHRARKSFLPKTARFGTFRHGSSMQASGGLPNVQRRSIAQPLGADDTIEPLSRKSEAVVCTVPWQGWAGLPESGVQEDSPLFLVVEAAQVTGDRSIFSSRAVLAMLQFKWKKFARGWYYLNLLLYIGFLVIISHHVTMLTMSTSSSSIGTASTRWGSPRGATASWCRRSFGASRGPRPPSAATRSGRGM